jgi:hypothetical protein
MGARVPESSSKFQKVDPILIQIFIDYKITNGNRGIKKFTAQCKVKETL